MAKLRITYTKSTIGYSKDQKETVRSLGLRKLNSTVIQDDTPSIRGMLFKVRHLVSVEEVAADATAKRQAPTHLTIVRPPADTQPAPAKAQEARQPSASDTSAAPAPRPAPSRETVVLPAVDLEVAPDEQTVAVESAADAADEERASSGETQALPAEDAAPAPKPDDLQAIEGIGPKIAGLLQDAGITTFAELAATSVARLEEILEAANLNLASPETWPEQAGLAASGDWDALEQLQDQLKGGRKE
jgi:ribosomal protein L30